MPVNGSSRRVMLKAEAVIRQREQEKELHEIDKAHARDISEDKHRVWQSKKGTKYTVILVSNSTGDKLEWKPQVVYRQHATPGAEVWSLPVHSFLQRMVMLPEED